jgi:hypothetical protein
VVVVVVGESEGITRGKISYDNSKRSASWVKVEITCVSNRLALVSRYQLYEKNGKQRILTLYDICAYRICSAGCRSKMFKTLTLSPRRASPPSRLPLLPAS